MNKVYQANTKLRKAGAAIITSDKVNFRAKNVIWDNKAHVLMIKEPI